MNLRYVCAMALLYACVVCGIHAHTNPATDDYWWIVELLHTVDTFTIVIGFCFFIAVAELVRREKWLMTRVVSLFFLYLLLDSVLPKVRGDIITTLMSTEFIKKRSHTQTSI